MPVGLTDLARLVPTTEMVRLGTLPGAGFIGFKGKGPMTFLGVFAVSATSVGDAFQLGFFASNLSIYVLSLLNDMII